MSEKKAGYGGRRKGSGRKKSAAKQLELAFIAEKQAEAEYGFALYVDAMRRGRSQKTRLYAAGVVMDRVWGKPRGDDAVTLRGVVATQDVSKLSPDARRKRIAELLAGGAASGIALPAGGGSAGPGAGEPN